MFEDMQTLVFLYGWLVLWPFARWVLRRTGRSCDILQWTLIVGFILEAAGLAWIWYLHQSGNPDWWMGWAVPNTVAAIAWLVSLVALVAPWLTNYAKAQRKPG